jgi:hypothetical protein
VFQKPHFFYCSASEIRSNFSKIGLLKSAILFYAAILSFIKKSSSIKYFKPLNRTLDEFFEKMAFLKNLGQQVGFTAYSKKSPPTWIFSKNFDEFVFRAQKSMRIDHLILQKQHIEPQNCSFLHNAREIYPNWVNFVAIGCHVPAHKV